MILISVIHMYIFLYWLKPRFRIDQEWYWLKQLAKSQNKVRTLSFQRWGKILSYLLLIVSPILRVLSFQVFLVSRSDEKSLFLWYVEWLGSFVGPVISQEYFVLPPQDSRNGFWNSWASLFPSHSFLVRLSHLSLVRRSSNGIGTVSFGLNSADLVYQGFFSLGSKDPRSHFHEETGQGHIA